MGVCELNKYFCDRCGDVLLKNGLASFVIVRSGIADKSMLLCADCAKKFEMLYENFDAYRITEKNSGKEFYDP